MSKLCDLGPAGFPNARLERRRSSGFPLYAFCIVANYKTELPLSAHHNPHYTSFEQPRSFPRQHQSILSLFCRLGFE